MVDELRRGDIRWVDLGEPHGSAPAFRRPVLVVQHDAFNTSRLRTVLVAVITSNTQAAEHPGNVFVPRAASGLPKDSAVNVSQVVTLDKTDVGPRVGTLPATLLDEVAKGLHLVLGL